MIRLHIPEIGPEELDAVREVLTSGWLVQGARVEEFERKMAGLLGVRYAVSVSSGTAALHLAVLALGLGGGDEVVVPDFTFPATANAVEIAGARPVFCDICPETFCMDPESLERRITKRTKAIIPVHEFGHMADMDPILELAARHGLHVIEDAACALGSAYKGVPAGALGEIGCFSFHPRKAITTGEGGMAVTNSPALAEKLRLLRNHGLAGGVFAAAGLNYRMTEPQGAMGAAQLSRLEEIVRGRIARAEIYDALLRGAKEVRPPVCKSCCRHSYQTYHVLLQPGTDRDAVIRTLKQRGVETNLGAYSVSSQPYYRQKYGDAGQDLPHAAAAYRRGLALPLHTRLRKEEQQAVVSELLAAVREDL